MSKLTLFRSFEKGNLLRATKGNVPKSLPLCLSRNVILNVACLDDECIKETKANSYQILDTWYT